MSLTALAAALVSAFSGAPAPPAALPPLRATIEPPPPARLAPPRRLPVPQGRACLVIDRCSQRHRVCLIARAGAPARCPATPRVIPVARR